MYVCMYVCVYVWSLGMLLARWPTNLLLFSRQPANLLLLSMAHTCALAWMMGWRGFRGFQEKCIFCCIHGPHKQYIQVDTMLNYIFHFGLPGTCLYLNKSTFLVPEKSALERCMFLNLSKDLCPKSKMKNGVKCDVNLDILLVGSIYVTTYVFFKEIPNSLSFCNPPSSRPRWALSISMPLWHKYRGFVQQRKATSRPPASQPVVVVVV